VLQPQPEQEGETDARRQQQVDQKERFGEDGKVLPGLFLGKAEIIVRTWD